MKPGFKTTEFWLTVFGAIGLLAGALLDALPEEASGIGVAILTAVYTISRTLTKREEGHK